MTTSNLNASVTYSVSFPNAVAHNCQISIEIDKPTSNTVRFKMPVWTPGSYKVREFSQNIDQTWYSTNNKNLVPARIDKNTWECKSTKGKALKFTYNLYAFEFGVRTSYVDQHMAFLHGPSAFMYAEGYEENDIIIAFTPLDKWRNIEMPLDHELGTNRFLCDNYDLLADSPVALGNFETTTYITANVPHKIVMIGTGNYDLKKVTEDFKKITDEEVKMFDNIHPSKQYIHFIQNVDNGGGGLEHLNCHTSQINRWAYQNEEAYLKFLGLVSHEYFHLWNVKRIRPMELGPFDYDQENYTELLWVAEGITSYFDDLFLKRAGIHTEESYLKAIAQNINRLENQPGKDVMTLSESSKLAWVKAYLANENSNNVTISYYNKGMLVSWMLDIEIMTTTNGKKRLDDVMRVLYQNYYEDKQRGFSYDEFVETCSEVCGKPLNGFFNKYVYTTERIPYASYLDLTGFTLKDNPDDKPSLGIKTKNDNGKCVISYVKPGGPASNAGLSVNDELIALNGWRIGEELNTSISGFIVGAKITLQYARDGKMFSTTIVPEANDQVKYDVLEREVISDSQQKYQALWLN